MRWASALTQQTHPRAAGDALARAVRQQLDGAPAHLVLVFAQIAAIADGFRATYEKVEGENGEYTMNHTAGVFLFDATGRFVTTIDYHEPREFAVPKIRRAMQNRTERAES